MRRLIAGAALIAAPLGAGPAAAQGQSTGQSIQQSFDAATALMDSGRSDEALAAWQALESRIARNPRSLAIVRLRKAQVLFALGRRDEAAEAAELGLEALPASDATLKEDRFLAHLTLATVAAGSLDYATAAAHYRQGLPLAGTAGERLVTAQGLVATETFVDPQAALGRVPELRRLLVEAAADKRRQGMVKSTISKLYLNLGRYEEASREAKEAVALLGGISTRTDLYDVEARSNAGLAELRLGRRDEARRYLAYTGAGRAQGSDLSPPAEMQPPPCGGEAGLRPEDVAIIEFSIGDDGTVTASAPVWASRPGEVALEFARVARGWYWSPDALKKLPPFFRYKVRVEMRCSTAFERPSLLSYLEPALADWLAGKGASPLEEESPARRLAMARSRLDQIERVGKGREPAAIPALLAIVDSPASGREESHALARRALDIAVAGDAAPLARLAIEWRVWRTRRADGPMSRDYARALKAAAASPIYSGSPEARALLALAIADSTPPRDAGSARGWLDGVAADPALPANHPLKVGALIRIASLDARAGELEAARANFERTGLSAEQCALLDAPPRVRRSGGDSSDFPEEARYWGFEGWVQTQADIDASGNPINVRPVLAYPPFVFSDAAAGVVSRMTYEPRFRPEGALSCGGNLQRVRFQMMP